MRVIGLTGGIASGKSAVENILVDKIPVIDADRTARLVVKPGSRGLQGIVASFGEGVLTEDGDLNRAKLREIIANSRKAQETLNSILHPLIAEAIQNQLGTLKEAGHTTAVVSAALMMETGSYRQYDDIILVTAPAEERLKRVLARDGMNEESARALMDKQWPDSKRRPLASVEISNDGTLEDLRTRTLQALQSLSIDF